MDTPPGYRIQSAETLPAYLEALPNVRKRLGGSASNWRTREVGDGNLNLVFIVNGPQGGVAVKQALPYVRLVGESWPLPLSRAHYEHMALTRHAALAPDLVPQVLHYDETLSLIVMELLEPHLVMRRGMIAGVEYPRFAGHISSFMAATLYGTSDMALPAAEKKALIAAFAGNTALCKITEDLIFTEPYMVAANNRWTSPQLDGIAKEFREDQALKAPVSRLKLKFLSSAEALIHGDLHTGSVMVTPEETKVIDPEFAFVGPMGFDVGAVIANLLLNYFAQSGHEEAPGARDAYRAWVLDCTVEVWTQFRAKFLALWRKEARGDAYPPPLFPNDSLEPERQAYMDRLFADTLGFAAAKMIRRILGLAHNIDFEWIQDPDRRASCELRSLQLAREMMTNTARFRTIDEVVAAAGAMRASAPN